MLSNPEPAEVAPDARTPLPLMLVGTDIAQLWPQPCVSDDFFDLGHSQR
jgi:hypothetical protein